MLDVCAAVRNNTGKYPENGTKIASAAIIVHILEQ